MVSRIPKQFLLRWGEDIDIETNTGDQAKILVIHKNQKNKMQVINIKKRVSLPKKCKSSAKKMQVIDIKNASLPLKTASSHPRKWIKINQKLRVVVEKSAGNR